MQAGQYSQLHGAFLRLIVSVNLLPPLLVSFTGEQHRGQQGVACVVSVVIGWWPRLVLSPVEHVLVPPQIVLGTQT